MSSRTTSWGVLVEMLRQAAPPLAAVFVLLLSFAVDVFDSFGLEDRTDKGVEYMTGALTAPFYGSPERPGQANVGVVLITQDAVDAFGFSGWPMPYAMQADLVTEIAAYRPRAIFLDFNYARLQRTNLLPEQAAIEIEDFARRLARVEESGVRVLLGPVRDTPELAPLKRFQQAGVAFVATEDFSYKLKDPSGRPMAGAAMRDIWCEGREPACAPLPASLDERVIAIDWGFGASVRMAPLLPVAERTACAVGDGRSRWATFFAVQRRAAFAALYEKDDYDPLVFRCPYFDTLAAHWVGTPPAGVDPAAFLQDRYVFVGADLPFLSDYAPTPLLGRAPGVTAHAMAFDNLIERGPDVARYPQQVWLGIDASDLLELSLVVIGLALVLLIARARRQRTGRVENLPWGTRLLALTVPGLVGVLVGAFIFRWPMVNIFSIVAVGSLVIYAHDLGQRFAGKRTEA